MSTTALRCPACRAGFKYSGPRAPGKKVTCPRCDEEFSLPRSAYEEPEDSEDEDRDTDDAPARRGPRRPDKRKQQSRRGLWIGLGAGGAAVLVVVAVLVFLMKAGGRLEADTAWVDFTPQGESFVISLPGKPRQRDANTYEVSFRAQRISFGLTYKDVPPVNPVEQDIAFNQTRDAMVRGIPGGRLVGESRISHGAYPGRDWEIRGTSPERYVLARDIAVNQRFYVLVAEGPDAASISAYTKKFIDSFRASGTTPATPGGPAQGGAAQGGLAGEQPSIVVSNVTLNRKEFFPKITLDYRFERGGPANDCLYHLVVTAASGKSYEQLLSFTDKTGKFSQNLPQLPKTEQGPFKVHFQMTPVVPNGKPVKISNVVSVD